MCIEVGKEGERGREGGGEGGREEKMMKEAVVREDGGEGFVRGWWVV